MSKITQIERELLIANDSIFHRLCSAYIHYKFNFDITDKGLAKGKDKPAKGTPDSYILESGKTLFVEITTQKNGIFNKFNKDVNKCLEYLKTGGKIEKIFLCYNSRLDVSEKTKLLDLGLVNDTKIEILTLDELKYDLHRPYGFLAKEFLGIEIDSDQILVIDRFIYENDKKTTTLQNLFISRKSDIEKLDNYLEQGNIVLLSGNPGTGKTRLAIEAALKYRKENPLLKTFVITSKGQSIYNDLQSYFLPNNEYLVIIDDANRIGDLNRIIELSLLDELSIQIIITVRDYALNKVIRQFQEFDKICFQLIKVEKLTNKEIEDILISVKITNPDCINKITNISNGNPRLALMASEFALETNNCNALNNVTDIYDKYFSKYINEIEELNDKNTLITLGIISFNRNLNKENIEFNTKTFEAFQIDENDFWENVYILHDLELVDLFEKQIVKISDQIIAEYFFYYIFSKQNVIDFSVLLNIYLSEFSGKIKDNLYPILNNFDEYLIMKNIKGSVDKFYESIKTNDDLVYKFFEIFWFDRKTELLIWLQDRIELIDVNTDLDFNINEPKNIFDIQKYPNLELLKLFGYHPDENFVISLEILFSYVFREPSILPDVVSYLKNDLAFKTQSSDQNYYIQSQLFDFLFEKVKNDLNTTFYKHLLLELSDKFLHIYFEDTKTGVRERNTFILSQVYIRPTENIKKIRSNLWKFLLSEFYNFEEKSFSVLSNYINQSFASAFRFDERTKKDTPAKQVAEFDEIYVLQFFENVLKNDNYLHCKLFGSFIDKCKDDGLNYTHLKKKFTNHIYEVSLVLKWDYINSQRNFKINSKDELKELKKCEVQAYFRNYKYEDYIQLLDDIHYIQSVEPNHSYGFQNSLEIAFLQLEILDSKMLFSILKHIFKTNNQLNFHSYQLINILVNNSKYEIIEVYNLISKVNYKAKSIWLQFFFSCLKEDFINNFFYLELLKMYEIWDTNTFVKSDFWENFKQFDTEIFITIFNILLNKTNNSDFSFDFDYWSIFDDYLKEFEKNYQYLNSLYFFKTQTDINFDYDKKYLNNLVEIDNEILFEATKKMCIKKDYHSSTPDKHAFDFVWKYENYVNLLEKSFEIIEQEHSFSEDIITVFFPANISDKVIDFITKFIIKHHNNEVKLSKIFNVITYLYPNERIRFLKILLIKIQNLEIIKSLELIRSSKTGGSLIPLYEDDKKFWKDFEELLSFDVKFLKLKFWTTQKQFSCEKSIESHRKESFVSDF